MIKTEHKDIVYRDEGEDGYLDVFGIPFRYFDFAMFDLKTYDRDMYDVLDMLLPGNHFEDGCYYINLFRESGLQIDSILAIPHFEHTDKNDVVRLSAIMDKIEEEYGADSSSIALMDAYEEKLILCFYDVHYHHYTPKRIREHYGNI